MQEGRFTRPVRADDREPQVQAEGLGDIAVGGSDPVGQLLDRLGARKTARKTKRDVAWLQKA
jgi:hypothetical protein